MRLSPVSLVGLLAVLAIIGYLTVTSIGAGMSGTGPTTGLGTYQTAINAAHQSVATQNASSGAAQP
jgi:hypothetical protein